MNPCTNYARGLEMNQLHLSNAQFILTVNGATGYMASIIEYVTNAGLS